MKLGRLKRVFDERVPKLLTLTLSTPLSSIPSSVDYTKGMPEDLGMMENNHLGNCTCAAFYHALQVWTHNTRGGKILTEPDNNVVELYEKACGYNPAEGGEGPGGVEQYVLMYLVNQGAPRANFTPHKLNAFFELDVHKRDYIKAAIYNCGVVYIGFEVPAYIIEPPSDPTEIQNQALSIWDVSTQGDQSIQGGHAVILAGYDEKGVKVISWGRVYTMTWEFFERYVDEAYALIDIDWFDFNKHVSPLGMDLDQLKEAMSKIKKG
jgi:hypothetical protein